MPQFRSPAARNAPTIHQSRVRSWRRMPSSTAYLERKGGASAVAVAARSETTESAVRVLYGLVRRASVSSLRRVRAHDQSSTSAPRCCVRWLPGCQTLTRLGFLVHARAIPHPYGWGGARRPRRRHYQPSAYASAPIRCQNAASGDLLHGRTRLDGVRKPPLEEAVLIDVAVNGARLEQLLVRPPCNDPPLVEDDDLVRERDPALADHRVVALRQSLHKLVRLRQPGDARELLIVEVAHTEGDVLSHRRGEEERILRDDTDRAPEG